MSASLVRHNKSAIWSASMLSALLRHLNMGTLATIMLVALALLSATHGKETEAKESATAGATKSGVVVDKHHEFIGAVRPGTSRFVYISFIITPRCFRRRKEKLFVRAQIMLNVLSMMFGGIWVTFCCQKAVRI